VYKRGEAVTEIQIIVPEGAHDALDYNLVILTREIDRLDPESVAHGCLGGEHGYGAHWDNAVFTMRPFYWGDCDCGADERSDKWHAAHPHAPDCFREELQRRFAVFDEESGWNAMEAEFRADDNMEERVEQTEFGTAYIRERTKKGEAVHKRWCAAHDKNTKGHTKLTRELYVERGIEPSPYQWLCTCGVDKLASAYFATQGHYPTCALELPNFLHKRTGLTVRWYKYIGRDMKAEGAPDDLEAMNEIFRECIESLKTSHSTGGGNG
jgi:hypothetical protein